MTAPVCHLLMHARFWSGIVLCSLVLVSGYARAERIVADGTGEAKRVALVVGIDQYDKGERFSLDNPAGDALAVAQALEKAGFDVALSVDADQRDLGGDISDFLKRSDGADAAVFFFAGHGVQIDGKNYLLTRSAVFEDAALVNQDGFELGWILDELTKRAKTTIAIVDACRDNPFEKALAANDPASRSVWGLSRGLAPLETVYANSLVAFATSPGQVSRDGTGMAHSPFATALLHHIKTPGVEISVLLKRITRDVLTVTGGEQRPEVVASMAEEFYFHRPVAFSSYDPDSTPQVGSESEAEVLLDSILSRTTKEAQVQGLKDLLTKYPQSAAAGRAANLLKVLLIEEPANPSRESQITPDPRTAVAGHLPSRPQIEAVQTELQRVGLFWGAVDGEWDASSENALKEAQRKLGTEPTGSVSDGINLIELLSLMTEPPECYVSFSVFPGKLRAEPGLLAREVTTLPLATEFRVLEQKDVLGTFWFKIHSGDHFGWVMDFNFLQSNGDECSR